MLSPLDSFFCIILAFYLIFINYVFLCVNLQCDNIINQYPFHLFHLIFNHRDDNANNVMKKFLYW